MTAPADHHVAGEPQSPEASRGRQAEPPSSPTLVEREAIAPRVWTHRELVDALNEAETNLKAVEAERDKLRLDITDLMEAANHEIRLAQAAEAKVARLVDAAIEAIALLDVAIAGTVFTKPDKGRVTVNIAKAQSVLDGLRTALEGEGRLRPSASVLGSGNGPSPNADGAP